MTRKHFVALAEMIRFMPLHDAPRLKREKLRAEIAQEVADTCARFSGGFDRDRFLAACRPLDS